jgi:bacillithiol biosynthesis deacetylase BshB1
MIDILVFGAHPDDIEFGCGGILAKMAAEGKTIIMVDLTLGDKGTYGNPEERKLEGQQAAAVIGATRVILDFKDCEILDTYEGRLQFVRVIRKYKPRLVLAPMWNGVGNHPDHLACGIMARYACRYARFAKILPEIPIHWVEGILHYLSLTDVQLDFLIDVSQHVDVWKKMMSCHKSQMQNFRYDEWNLHSATKLGSHMGVAYAQGLAKGNPIVIPDPFVVAQSTREL